MQANSELSGIVPDGVPEALAALGFAVEEVADIRGDGSHLVFLVDEESSLAHAEVLLAIGDDGHASFRYLDADDYEDTIAMGCTDADYERFVGEIEEKVRRLNAEVAPRISNGRG